MIGSSRTRGLAVVVLGGVLAGCSSATATTTPSLGPSISTWTPSHATPRGLVDASRVNRRNATAVAVAWATDSEGFDTHTDTSPLDANKRALRWTTTEYQTKFGTSSSSAPAGAAWQTWFDHDAYGVVSVHLDTSQGAPADTTRTAYRVLDATVVAVGANRWRAAAGRSTWFVTLTRPSATGAWAVSNTTLGGSNGQ